MPSPPSGLGGPLYSPAATTLRATPEAALLLGIGGIAAGDDLIHLHHIHHHHDVDRETPSMALGGGGGPGGSLHPPPFAASAVNIMVAAPAVGRPHHRQHHHHAVTGAPAETAVDFSSSDDFDHTTDGSPALLPTHYPPHNVVVHDHVAPHDVAGVGRTRRHPSQSDNALETTGAAWCQTDASSPHAPSQGHGVMTTTTTTAAASTTPPQCTTPTQPPTSAAPPLPLAPFSTHHHHHLYADGFVADDVYNTIGGLARPATTYSTSVPSTTPSTSTTTSDSNSSNSSLSCGSSCTATEMFSVERMSATRDGTASSSTVTASACSGEVDGNLNGWEYDDPNEELIGGGRSSSSHNVNSDQSIDSRSLGQPLVAASHQPSNQDAAQIGIHHHHDHPPEQQQPHVATHSIAPAAAGVGVDDVVVVAAAELVLCPAPLTVLSGPPPNQTVSAKATCAIIPPNRKNFVGGGPC